MANLHQTNVENVPSEHRMHRVGHWLPGDHRIHKEWLNHVIDKVDNNPKTLHPALQEFQDVILADTRLYLLVNQMFEEIPKKKPYRKDPTGHKQIRDFHHMVKVLNHILSTAPEWSDKSFGKGFVGTPINAVFDWPMGTAAGFAFFLDPKVNELLKKVLDAWGEFLASPESAYVLERGAAHSWFGQHGVQDLTLVATLGQKTFSASSGEAFDQFEKLFQCDPSDSHYGYKSWDDFFTRHFHPSARPVASPDDDNVIANACESKPFQVARNIKARDRFWIKSQPYSVVDMLAHDELHNSFIGGTIYQAFLSALSYHRWHAPVSGKVVKAYVAPGTYYSEPLFEGLGEPGNHEIDVEGEKTSQGYLTATATRAILFIEADNPRIGLMCFLGIGMTEVSTCDITVKQGQHIKKGDELGMFHFGGSSHCLLFRKGVEVNGFPDVGGKENFPVRAKVATVG